METRTHFQHGPDHQAVARFILQQIRDGLPAQSQGAQSRIYRYTDPSGCYAVKIPRSGVMGGCIGRWMIHRERRVYERLTGLPGVPRCHGLVEGRYLVLDFMAGESFRDAQTRLPPDHDYFEQLRILIDAIHARGVAHTDLKRKDNLLVLDNELPCLIDFGAAMVRRSDPLSRVLFLIARRFDRNAWIKLKYNGYRNIPPDERRHLRRLPIERVSHWLKRRARHLRRALVKHKERLRP
ncbi:hypothetical protein [Candidatus Macondimonas diazotrophica]|uniref:Protein kinase domain-containing protein n=1 Tax=Candidatus Macondimonas diazotrophica TaxID=2305248 RepID=A0A4Z0FAX4_9GAMM|nr:hypothetical protein [Candidatus Macondimonas diazotrophica]TFZ82835.1 hypothetical protein E4680_06025 [Candidatus Macondimonas diazotrophica]HBG30998.1 hypothetical protein [Gammaproteobacteria bacterium]HBG52435.1 hypothetical protein [Gammaproteobacteria bacterium]